MTDLDIIKGYSNDTIQGITITPHCFFMPVRITGLGKTIRVDEATTIDNLKNALKIDDNSLKLDDLINKAKENNLNIEDYIKYCIFDRKAEDFASDEIMEVYQGMPILRGHPKVDGAPSLLSFYNLKNNPIIGTVIKAFRKNNALWGLAKVFDLKLIDEFKNYQSTSPAVYSINQETPSGLIIEKPNMFNHLAFVEQGHWDQIDKEPYDISKINITKQEENFMPEDDNKLKDAKTDEAIEKVNETEVAELQKDVSELKENESKEAEKFEELAKDHNILKGDQMPEETKVDNETINVEKIEEENKVDDDIEKVDEDNEKVDEDNEKVDEDEIEGENLTEEDEESSYLVDSFRKIMDEAHPSLGLKMPYLGNKRLKPSAIIHKILNSNSRFVDSKYMGILLDSSNKKTLMNYSLQIDALNSLIDNVSKASNKALREEGSGKKNHWEKTSNPNIQIDRNF